MANLMQYFFGSGTFYDASTSMHSPSLAEHLFTKKLRTYVDALSNPTGWKWECDQTLFNHVKITRNTPSNPNNPEYEIIFDGVANNTFDFNTYDYELLSIKPLPYNSTSNPNGDRFTIRLKETETSSGDYTISSYTGTVLINNPSSAQYFKMGDCGPKSKCTEPEHIFRQDLDGIVFCDNNPGSLIVRSRRR